MELLQDKKHHRTREACDMGKGKGIVFANRMGFLESSGIRKMFELVQKMKNPLDLSLGQPHFDVPDNVKQAAIKAIQDGKNRYTITSGIKELREGIRDSLVKEGVKAEEIIATAGASGGLVLAFLALADENVEVLIPDPGFVTYGHIVRLSGARVNRVSTYPDFRLTPQKIEKAIKESSHPGIQRRMLLFNNPVNPTGIAYTVQEIKALCETAKRLHLQVISDEVYDRFSYDFDHECWLKYDPSAILVRTFGKTWGMVGWRAGYAAGPKGIIDQMTMIQQFSFVCVNSPTQWACIEALKTDVSDLIEQYRKKRDYVYEGLKTAFNVHKPQGAFYIFPEAPDGDMDGFLKKCIENEILVVPGNSFSERNSHFRVSFALEDEKLKKGVDLLVKLAK